MTNDRIRWAMRMNESSNNYGLLGPVITNGGRYHGDRAYGAYQVMGLNVPSWTEEALGRRMTPQEFLRDRRAQDQVFDYHFGRQVQRHGSLEDAASVWHSGRPLAQAQRATDGYMRTPDYVQRYMRYYEQAGGQGAMTPARHQEPRQPSRQQQLVAATEASTGATNRTSSDGLARQVQPEVAAVQPTTGRDWSFVQVLDDLRRVAQQSGFSNTPQRSVGGPRMARQVSVLRSSQG